MDEKNPVSMFRLVTIGVAAENKKLSSMELEVVPIEITPYLDGELVSSKTDINDAGEDAFGQKYTVKTSMSNSLVATWLQWGSNRATAPDVRRGERVLLYQFADEDKYYWISAGLDDHLRRLETAIFVFSNVKDNANTKLNIDNTYSLEVSTHAKHVTLRTSKSDGEPFAYTFQFNTKEGAVTLADDDDNYFEFDSSERKLTLKNKDTSFITIDKREIKAFAPDLIHMEAKDIQAHCTTMLVKASESITMQTVDFSLTADASITMETATALLKASATTTIDTPQCTITGNMTVNGFSLLSGGFAAGGSGAPGSATINVPMTTNQPVTSNAEVTVNGIPMSTHKHTEQGDGAPVSPPIP